MKKLTLISAVLGLALLGAQANTAGAAVDFGDYRSVTLTTKAWNALANDDLEGVLAYTNKCLELYEGQAKKMQNNLTGYVTGTNDEIFAMWALNDVATSLFIQGEAYRKAGRNEDAMEAYNRVIDEFSYGQTWDTKGWFWKPAEASKEKVSMIKSGSNLDFGDYSSSYLTTQAWKALGGDDAEAVMAYTDKVLELYKDKAKDMQDSMTEYAWESDEAKFAKWALNDVGTALFIKGEAYKKAGDTANAKKAYQELVNNFYYAQCWDPNGWFWKPAEAAQQSLDELGSI